MLIVCLNDSKKLSCNNQKLCIAKLLSLWVTVRLLNKFDKKNKLYNILKKRPYDTVFKNYFHKYRVNLKAEIDLTKNQYYSNLISSCN